MTPEHDFPCEHCGPQVRELARQVVRLRAALTECLRVATEDDNTIEAWLRITHTCESALNRGSASEVGNGE